MAGVAVQASHYNIAVINQGVEPRRSPVGRWQESNGREIAGRAADHEVTIGRIMRVPRETTDAEREEFRKQLEAEMREITRD